jgi:hypothetical protein
MRFSRPALAAAVFLLLGLALASEFIESQTTNVVYLRWFSFSNPSPLDDYPFATCVISDYLYVVGSDTTRISHGFRVEKRLKNSGELVKVWSYNPTPGDDILFDCTTLDERLYVAGIEMSIAFPRVVDTARPVVAVLDQDLNLLRYVKLNISGLAMSITTDGSYIYVGGYYFQGPDRGWFIAKLDKDLNTVKLALYNPSQIDDYIYQIRYSEADGRIWIVGTYNALYVAVAYVDPSLSQDPTILSLGITGAATSITFDDHGNKYVAVYGSMGGRFVGLLKIDSSNRLVAYSSNYVGSSIAWVWGYLYAIYTGDAVKVTVLDENLNTVTSYTVNESTRCGISFTLGSIAYDERSLYFATPLCPSGDSGWGIYSLNLVIQLRIVTRVITATQIVRETVTSTIVRSYTETVTVMQTATLTETQPLWREATRTVTVTQTLNNSVTPLYTVTKTIERVSRETIALPTTITYTEVVPVTVTSVVERTLMRTVSITITTTETITMAPVDSGKNLASESIQGGALLSAVIALLAFATGIVYRKLKES